MIGKMFNRIQVSNSYFNLYFIVISVIYSTNSFTQSLKSSPIILFITIDDLKPELGC
jgi:hypothetical protein